MGEILAFRIVLALLLEINKLKISVKNSYGTVQNYFMFVLTSINQSLYFRSIRLPFGVSESFFQTRQSISHSTSGVFAYNLGLVSCSFNQTQQLSFSEAIHSTSELTKSHKRYKQVEVPLLNIISTRHSFLPNQNNPHPNHSPHTNDNPRPIITHALIKTHALS